MYLEDGSLFENEGVSSPVTLSIQRQEKPIRCECLSWHPNEPILAVGWEDGSIAIWSYTERYGVLNFRDDTYMPLNRAHCRVC